MKNVCILFFLLSLCAVFSVYGVSKGLHIPRAGDKLELCAVDFSDTIVSGNDCVWDLSKSAVSGKLKLEFVSEGEDSLSYIVGRTKYKICINGDTIKALGFENNLSNIDFSESEILLITGMSHGDSHFGVFSGCGSYADMRKHEMRGRYALSSDAQGALITLDGDTIPNVFRLTSERRSKSFYTSGDSLSENQQVDSVQLRLMTSYLYAEGYRYPLLLSRTLYLNSDSILFHKAYCTPLAIFDDISDYENEELRAVLSQQINEEYCQSNPNSNGREKTIEYTFVQDKSSRTVTINYSALSPTKVEFVLCDINGIVYGCVFRQCNSGESYSITFDYGELPNVASYGVNIKTETEFYSEKFYR